MSMWDSGVLPGPNAQHERALLLVGGGVVLLMNPACEAEWLSGWHLGGVR